VAATNTDEHISWVRLPSLCSHPGPSQPLLFALFHALSIFFFFFARCLLVSTLAGYPIPDPALSYRTRCKVSCLHSGISQYNSPQILSLRLLCLLPVKSDSSTHYNSSGAWGPQYIMSLAWHSGFLLSFLLTLLLVGREEKINCSGCNPVSSSRLDKRLMHQV
jgi:hypothetical protein